MPSAIVQNLVAFAVPNINIMHFSTINQITPVDQKTLWLSEHSIEAMDEAPGVDEPSEESNEDPNVISIDDYHVREFMKFKTSQIYM